MATAYPRGFRREPGDWSCSQCNEVNFQSRTACRRCFTARNQSIQTNATTAAAPPPPPQHTWRPSDWKCRHCNAMNFAGRDACFQCQRSKSESVVLNNPLPSISKPGDWICQGCANNNFAARIACHRCGRPKAASVQVDMPPQAAIKPGDWKCPSCPEINFGSRAVCRSCGAARPSADNKSTGNQGECVVCMDKPIDTVITTCGHSAVCLQCSTSITQCPMCRNPFTQQQIIKFYAAH